MPSANSAADPSSADEPAEATNGSGRGSIDRSAQAGPNAAANGDAESARIGGSADGTAMPDDVAVTTESGAASANSGSSRRRKKSRRFSFLRETAIVVVTALVLSILIKTFLVQSFYIPSGSMEDTLHEGDRILVSRLVPSPLSLHRGDVVVFKDPGNWLTPEQTEPSNAFSEGARKVFMAIGLLPQDSGDHLVKRVIGLPGDHVTCCNADGLVEVNGAPITETYIKPGVAPSQTRFDVTVPKDMLFVLGDNRSNSEDSRYQTAKPGEGFVPVDNVVGSVVAVMWPFSHAKIMRNPAAVFKNVPNP